MANQITYAATITPATAPMEVSTNGGTSFVPLTFATVGSNQQATLTGVTAATYAIGQLQLRAVGYSATMLSNAAAVTVIAGAAQTYTQAVVADAPIYYNRLNTAALAPQIGTGTFTLPSGGTTLQPSALTNDTASKSLYLDGVNNVAVASIDLSAHAVIAIEFWTNCASLGVPYVVFGDPTWDTVVGGGGWAYAFSGAPATAGQEAYMGTKGNVGPSDKRGPQPGLGWVHVVIKFTANGPTDLLHNGVSQTLVLGSPTTTNTNKFANTLLRLKGANASSANIQELAIYGTTIPTNARFAAHAAAKAV